MHRYFLDFPSGEEELEALRYIFLIDDRAMFDFVVTRKSLEEAKAKMKAKDPLKRIDGFYLTQWIYDIADHTEACLSPPGAILGYGQDLSKK